MNERFEFETDAFDKDLERDGLAELESEEEEEAQVEPEAEDELGWEMESPEAEVSTAADCKCAPKKTQKEREASIDATNAEWLEELWPAQEYEALADEQFEGVTQNARLPSGPFGTLTVSEPSRRFSYAFTPDDVLWTARFIVGEAGGRNDLDNQAVIWAMLNRYALFTHKYYKTFHSFIRAYSTPLQPVLRSWGAAKRHMHKPDFVRTGGSYKPPHDNIPKGQLRNFLNLQQRPWEKLPAPARALALNALSAKVPNPIGNASEFGSTHVYFRDRHRRNPSDEEWRHFTSTYARSKGWQWIGPVSGLNQKKNAFFVQSRVARLPRGTVRVIPAGGAGRLEREAYEYEQDAELDQQFEWREEEYEDDCPDCPELEEEFRLSTFPEVVLAALRAGNEKEAIKRALQAGFTKEDVTDLIFFWRHPERRDAAGTGRPIAKQEPGYEKLKKEWLDIRKGPVESGDSKSPLTGGQHPEVNALMPKQGVGFYCRMPDQRRWALPETVMALTAAAARWFVKYPNGPRIVISDLSKKGGGPFSPHKSHQYGLDVDIRLVRKDDKDTSGGLTCAAADYSRERTRELITLLRGNGVVGVKDIGFCDRGVTFPDFKLSPWSGHHNHLHVRFCLPAHYQALKQRTPKLPSYRC